MKSKVLGMDVELNRDEVASSERGMVETETIQADSFNNIYTSCDKRRWILNTLP
jgi:hypothetical protein